ncbi:hypothetical protein CHH57_02135 [Niallia circulans]|uniref:Uncharacterized protein n=2 Tax=Niallia circulans TaxID=1397 RepID=A0AA91TWM2_NIACI|nr:hypothetical protein CHH57_02135 [Niallia circulans]
MGRMVKCPYCENQVDKDISVAHSKRYYHKECYEEFSMQKQYRDELMNYIAEIYNIDPYTNGTILKQIKEYQDEFKFKLKGIELALRYFYHTLNNPVKDTSTIGIVPFVYEEAKRHYITVMQAAETAEKYNGEFTSKREVKILSPKLELKRQVNIIDIASL